MSRNERKVYFERLVAMREAYRAEAHDALELTMADAMAIAQRLLAEEDTAQAAATGAKPADGERDA
jgi:hypothetical protein